MSPDIILSYRPNNPVFGDQFIGVIVGMLRVKNATQYTQHAFPVGCRATSTASAIDQDFEAVLRKEEPQGLNAVFDSMGGSYISKSYRLLARGGVFVSYAFMGRPGKAYWDTLTGAIRNELLGIVSRSKRTAICSVPNEIKSDKVWYQSSLTRLLELTAENQIAPTTREIFDLKEASAAHRLLESREKSGKVLLRVD